MIKSWQKFNESYDQSLINFNNEESEAFNTYYKKEVWGKLCGDNLDKKEPVLELLNEFVEIVNEEFDSNIKVSPEDIQFSIIEPFVNKNNNHDISSSHPGVYPSKENASKAWELLKYKNYKPGYVSKIKLTIDEELRKAYQLYLEPVQLRWCHYYQKVLDSLNKIPNTDIYVYMGSQTNTHSRHEVGHMPFYVYIRYEDFKFKDPFDKKNIIEFIQSYPQHTNVLYKWADKDEIFDFIVDHPEIKSQLKGQNLLDFTKKYKSINDPQRTQMESENQMYIFIARPSFKEQPDGNYKKDIEIENLVAIDPYDSKDAYALSMMKLRARMQSNNSEVYCIWLPNDFEDSDLRNINDDSMTYLRKLIDQKKERI